MNSIVRCCILVAMLAILPGAACAADPVDKLADALKIEIGGIEPDLQLADRRNKIIEEVIPQLKTVSQLRRAYFLKQWATHIVRPDKADKRLDVEPYRAAIGDKLTKAIRGAAGDADPIARIAVALLIAELADPEAADIRPTDPKAFDAKNKERFARSLSDVAKALVKDKDIGVRQAGLNALGKVANDPAEAFPLINEVLRQDEVGPRRLAAYALSDLVKSARGLERQQKMQTAEQVLASAVIGLGDADEPVRGYSLQAITVVAKLVADHFSTAGELVDDNKKRVLRPDLQKLLKNMQSINAPLLEAIDDPRPNIRMAALQTLDQIGLARGKILNTLADAAPDLRDKRGELLKLFDAPDPVGPIVDKGLKSITRLLREDDVRLRKAAIDFLEALGDQAAPAADSIAEALSDADRFVRLSAARAIRNLPAKSVGPVAVRGLGAMLIDADPDSSAAAASAIETLGPAAQDAVDWLGFVIANGDADNRNWDSESRVAAMKALIAVGTPAQRVLPQVSTALADPDVRVRRKAAETIGRIGRPTDESILEKANAALRRALSDADAEVRLNASEAILSIRK